MLDVFLFSSLKHDELCSSNFRPFSMLTWLSIACIVAYVISAQLLVELPFYTDLSTCSYWAPERCSSLSVVFLDHRFISDRSEARRVGKGGVSHF